MLIIAHVKNPRSQQSGWYPHAPTMHPLWEEPVWPLQKCHIDMSWFPLRATAAHSTTLSIWYCSYYRINWHPYGLAKLFAKYKLIVWLHASLTDASSPSPRPVSAFPIFTLRIILVETDTKTWRNNKSCEQQISQLPRGRGEARILQRISVTVTINYSNRFFG